MVAERTSERRVLLRHTPWTLEAFGELSDEDENGLPVLYELWDGELVEMSRPGTRHGSVLLRIATVLMNQGEWEGLGKVVGADSGIVLAPNPPVTVFGADVGFLRADQLPAQYTAQDWLLTMPALIVEVRSARDEGRHSLGRKIKRYLKHGVDSVWEVDPVAQAVIVHRQGAEPVRLGIEDELTAEGIIPSLRFPIRRLFAEPEAALGVENGGRKQL